ncbi:unknown [Clostridium sp. CAG:465]|nr:unknown [Clostridium sp. CAG:465]
MYASEVKKVTVERQYDYVMSIIEEYFESENIEAKILVDISTLCDDTIDMLLTDGFDVTKITADEKVIIYEISWENSVEDKKGEFKHVNINEMLSKINTDAIEERISNMFSIFGGNRNHCEDDYDPTEDDEGFECYC